jgi:hypothetical protein
MSKPKRNRKDDPVTTIVRVPVDLHRWLKSQAEAETRTMTTIVLRSLVAERAKLEQSEA